MRGEIRVSCEITYNERHVVRMRVAAHVPLQLRAITSQVLQSPPYRLRSEQAGFVLRSRHFQYESSLGLTPTGLLEAVVGAVSAEDIDLVRTQMRHAVKRILVRSYRIAEIGEALRILAAAGALSGCDALLSGLGTETVATPAHWIGTETARGYEKEAR